MSGSTKKCKTIQAHAFCIGTKYISETNRTQLEDFNMNIKQNGLKWLRKKNVGCLYDLISPGSNLSVCFTGSANRLKFVNYTHCIFLYTQKYYALTQYLITSWLNCLFSEWKWKSN